MLLFSHFITRSGRQTQNGVGIFFCWFGVAILQFECCLVHGPMTGSLVSAHYVLEEVSWAVDKMRMRDVCFVCLVQLHELLVGTLISLMNTYAGCSTPTLNFIEHFDFGRSI